MPIQALIPVNFTAHTQPKISIMPITRQILSAARQPPKWLAKRRQSDRRVREEHWDKARDDQDGGTNADENTHGNQLADGAPHKAPDHGIRREHRWRRSRSPAQRRGSGAEMPLKASDSSATNIRTPRIQVMMKIATAKEKPVCRIYRPSSGFARHRLYNVDAKGEQNGAKENGHHNRGETMLSWKILSQPGSLRSSTLSSFSPDTRHFIGNPRGKLCCWCPIEKPNRR